MKIVQSNLFIYFHDHQRINEGGLGNSLLSECLSTKKQKHNHPISYSLSHKLPRKICSDMEKTLEDNPYLTTCQIACGQGIGYRPGSADIAGTSCGRLDYHRKKALKDTGLTSKGLHVISETEKMAEKIDNKGSQIEGLTTVSKKYNEVG